MKFHNPYYFIPVENRTSPTTPYDDIIQGETNARHLRHDHWEKGALSGRILCRLKTITPVLVGAEQHPIEKDGDTMVVENYMVNEALAIPGNSLRGVIGNVAETLSASAMRVLEDETYSVRVDYHNALHAIGIVHKSHSGSWQVRPLCLTSFDSNEPKYQKWRSIFRDGSGKPMAKAQWLAAYVGSRGQQDANGKGLVESALTYQARFNNELSYLARSVVGKTKDQVKHFEVGEYHDFQDLAATKDSHHWLAGGLYALGDHHSLASMPKTKKHVIFVPMDENQNLPPIPLSDQVIADFEEIAKARYQEGKKANKKHKAKIPHLPNGYQRHEPPFIRSGDLIYFDIEEVEKGTGQFTVSEVSYSAIWRKSVHGSTHDFFYSATESEDILPWGSRERTALTPVEALFGVVDENEKKRPARNLASRVRFSDGLIDHANPRKALMSSTPDEPLYTFKILASPKPPSPSMYFHRPGGGYIAKEELRAEDKAFPQYPNGRKYYRHNTAAEGGTNGQPWPWEDDPRDAAGRSGEDDEESKDHLKLHGRPIKKDKKFWFHVDFENLRPVELQLLLLAINPSGPTREVTYHHKIGLGKPIGLGSVHIEVGGVFLVDRRQRYRATDDDRPRYHQRLVKLPNMLAKEDWSDLAKQRYPLEWQSMEDACETPLKVDEDPLIQLELWQTLVGFSVNQGDLPVDYPRTENSNDIYEWFVKNGDIRNQGQMLFDHPEGLDRRYRPPRQNVALRNLPQEDGKKLFWPIKNACQQQLGVTVSGAVDVDARRQLARFAVRGDNLVRLKNLPEEERKLHIWGNECQLELDE